MSGSNSTLAWLSTYFLLPSRYYKQDARLTSRVETIKQTIASAKHDIDVRRHLVELAKADGKYCLACSRQPDVASCGSSCPLMRTKPWFKSEQLWLYMAAKDVQKFDKLERDVDMYGAEANGKTVWEWELIIKGLLERTEVSPNRKGTLPMKTQLPGFVKDWTFEDHWGKGSGPGEEVAPDKIDETVKDETTNDN